MQLPATYVALAPPLRTTLAADSALLSVALWSPDVYVPFGTWVGFEHCAASVAASRLQAQSQSAGRIRIFDTPRDFDDALISRSPLIGGRGRCGRHSLLQLRDAIEERLILPFLSLAKFPIFPILLDQSERQFLDFGQQLGLHFPNADALFFDFRFGWDIRQVVVGLNERVHFAEWPQAVTGLKDVVRPFGVGDDDLLRADSSFD
jgi:hypothetical protein